MISTNALNQMALATAMIACGYVLPAIRSARAVIRKDSSERDQWISYFSILFLLNLAEPFLDLALHPWLKILLILWLSSPKHRGASAIFRALFVPCLDRYEGTVDEELSRVRSEARRRFFDFMARTGYRTWKSTMEFVARARSGRLFEEGSSEPRKDQEYARDFLETSKRSLFVVATVRAADGTTEGDSHQLRVFAYREERKAFVLSRVNNGKGDAGEEDVMVLAVEDIKSIGQTGLQGILVLMEDGTEAEIQLSGKEDRDTLLEGLKTSWRVLREKIETAPRVLKI